MAHDAARDVAGRLINDPCFNIAAAGAIMRIYLDESHGNVVQAVGYYHSHTPELAGWYQIRVIRASFVLFGRPAPEATKARVEARAERGRDRAVFQRHCEQSEALRRELTHPEGFLRQADQRTQVVVAGFRPLAKADHFAIVLCP